MFTRVLACRMMNVPRLINFVREKHIQKRKQIHVEGSFIKFTN